MNFIDHLNKTIQANNSLLCIGLDPLVNRFPESIKQQSNSIFAFNKAIIDATFNHVCAYKPQIAHYNAIGAEDQLEQTIDYIQKKYNIPVILDSKRGDIGSTAAQYATEAFVRYHADAVTVNPYMGSDCINEFTKYQHKGVIILCRTSNPNAGEIQDLPTRNNTTVYENVARLCIKDWNANNNILMVIGSTNPEQLQKIRALTDEMIFLLPGVGAQGADIEQCVSKGLNSKKSGIIINASRSIIYASEADDFAVAAQQAAITLQNAINNYR
jgi:orotidine-5'-phosphate decarboxylase